MTNWDALYCKMFRYCDKSLCVTPLPFPNSVILPDDNFILNIAQSGLRERFGPHTYHLLDSSYALALLFRIAEVAEKLLILAFLAASIWGAVNFFGEWKVQ